MYLVLNFFITASVSLFELNINSILIVCHYFRKVVSSVTYPYCFTSETSSELQHGEVLGEDVSSADHAVHDCLILPCGDHRRLHHQLHRSGGRLLPHAV